MTQSLTITNYIDSLSEAETRFGLSPCPDPNFFTEWRVDLPPLTTEEQQRLDLIKQRYLYHRKFGYLLEGGVNFIVIAPLLELAGFYDAPFRLRSEASVRIEISDAEDRVYQGRIDSLVVQENLWIILVEAKRTSFSIDVALPQVLAYMAANSVSHHPTFGLVSNGGYSMFVKLENHHYGLSDNFSLNRQNNELYRILQILNYLKTLP
ncbi:type I restriction endonuclease subunit R [Leptolyngbya sp. BL0902]|uniref:type I restriction endonuclease subunit R n=1 Tax=Leptolyngbya sp. BL0902 TaxID=1115757 RepID=UPI0018E7761F|nr:type I restriction endonuclease subunit R [Leptolyngbya sp. BL0902]